MAKRWRILKSELARESRTELNSQKIKSRQRWRIDSTDEYRTEVGYHARDVGEEQGELEMDGVNLWERKVYIDD